MSDEIKKGLLGIVVDETEVSKVMPEINSLTYRGYAAQDLCEYCRFEEVAYLILNKDLENIGFNIVIYPVTTQRLAMKNVEDGLRDIYANGHQNNIIDKMQTRKRLYELVEYEKYNSLDEKIYNFSTEGHE